MPAMYLEPTEDSGRRYFARPPEGPIVTLNLLRFRAIADYAAAPELAPSEPISGAEAYALYVAHTFPFLEASGGEILFHGRGDGFLIGPFEERWDVAMLVRHRSAATFLAFASNEAYLAGTAHRTAAVEDSRLLPLLETAA